MGGSEALIVIQKRWDSVCRVLFGAEIGAITDYKDWLLRYTEPIMMRKSSVSGKEVAYAYAEYVEGSKWVGFDEVDFQSRAQALTPDAAASMDLLIKALCSRFLYAGSSVLGNSKFVERSSGITDSFYVYETGKLSECKYNAFSTFGKLAEDCFGFNGDGESAFCIKCHETFRDRRCFELWQSRSCSDCYYSHNLDDCQECLFCFNAKNLRHAIGNLQLPKEKYYEIKKRLQAEMLAGLRRDRRLPSLMDIAAKCGKPSAPSLSAAGKAEACDKGVIEEAFAKTCSVVLGRRLPGGIDSYSEWLRKNIRKSETLRSCATGKPVHRWDYCCCYELPRDRMLTIEEARELGETARMAPAQAESITLANAHERIGAIAYFCPEYRDGMNMNNIECANCGDSAHCYRSSPVIFSKYAGYSFWPRSSEHMFGCGSALSSEFCINCYNSMKLARCFEVDFSRECTGLYFCHNCENVHDSMFCFNAKNLRYAIGNAEVGREKFMEMKKRLLGWVGTELEEKKGLRWDIYNIGAKG